MCNYGYVDYSLLHVGANCWGSDHEFFILEKLNLCYSSGEKAVGRHLVLSSSGQAVLWL